MMWPPVYSFVLQQPVVCLEINRKRPNRAARRRRSYGKLSTWDRLDGKLSPKQFREGVGK